MNNVDFILGHQSGRHQALRPLVRANLALPKLFDQILGSAVSQDLLQRMERDSLEVMLEAAREFNFGYMEDRYRVETTWYEYNNTVIVRPYLIAAEGQHYCVIPKTSGEDWRLEDWNDYLDSPWDDPNEPEYNYLPAYLNYLDGALLGTNPDLWDVDELRRIRESRVERRRMYG